VVASITVEGNTVGLLHATRLERGSDLDELDVELAALYSDGLARVFERAVLRDQLERQRVQLQAAAQWVNARMLELATEAAPVSFTPTVDGKRDADLLTPRELDVMRLIARGQSNKAIAASLVLGEGTIKYHVKNILRKLGARGRTEAISRYVRLYGGRDIP
jgi:DNA-binding NarL/FixJ family response regulator